MSPLETAAATGTGLVLITLAVVDIFETLLRADGRGPLSRRITVGIWRVIRAPGRRRLILFAGPLALLGAVGLWASLLVLGWALVLWPHLEDGFTGATASPGFVDALHVSLATITTLGFTDLVPDAEWLQIITPLEALVGFGLLSASISYLLLIYPVLARRRTFAYELFLLRESEARSGVRVEDRPGGAPERLYAELTLRLTAIERDLIDFPVTYYFADRDRRFSLAATAPYLLQLVRRCAKSEVSDAGRLRAELLANALDELAATLRERFPHIRADSTDGVLAAYAQDHLLERDGLALHRTKPNSSR